MDRNFRITLLYLLLTLSCLEISLGNSPHHSRAIGIIPNQLLFFFQRLLSIWLQMKPGYSLMARDLIS